MFKSESFRSGTSMNTLQLHTFSALFSLCRQ